MSTLFHFHDWGKSAFKLGKQHLIAGDQTGCDTLMLFPFIRFNNLHWTHHVIIFMFEYMAMPYIVTSEWAEFGDNTCDLPRWCCQGIFPAFFVRFRWFCRSCENNVSIFVITVKVEWPGGPALEIESNEYGWGGRN
ncbi:hypothetical protein SAMN04488072_10741 [Lentibacillus halodurans]|uniref:Uncharacterized protein n=1 Tax=Lentibacillus halodurans TaxID=237679 RepID=A0A1I0YDB5_9BACI|nr:hypothetical protein SAMN04488072_10741 [Lentibacillus halodurans]